MDTDILDQTTDRKLVTEAEVRSILQRFMRLLAREVARRLPVPNVPEHSRSPRDA